MRRTGHTSITAVVMQERDITRVAPCRAIWKCDCGFTNWMFFNFTLIIGSVYGRKMKCEACGTVYKGRLITDPYGKRF